MRVKIVSDGTRRGTLVTDLDTGKGVDLPGQLEAVEWKIPARGAEPVCFLRYRVRADVAELDVETPAEVTGEPAD